MPLGKFAGFFSGNSRRKLMLTVHDTSPDKLRNEWLARLTDLVNDVKCWADAMEDWSTRQITKNMEDSEIGRYESAGAASAESGASDTPRSDSTICTCAEGVVDLYLMPAYDDIASLYFYGGQWYVHYASPGTPAVASSQEAESKPLSAESLREVS